jgi:pyruvate dehydrogenase E2 component (dihydrolipoamide acetyltransferase)
MQHTTRITGWRRIANAMWHAPDDPQIFGALELDATPVLAFIERARASGLRVTPTHLVGRAVAHALQAVPDLNVQIRRGRARPRPSIDVFFITAVDKGHDLSGVKIVNIANKSVLAVASELFARSTAMKQGKDPDFTRSKRLLDGLPSWLLRGALRATAFVTEELQLELPLLALRRSPFGSAMVTSVGMFGLPQGFAPLAWMYDVPLLVLVGEIAQRPVVVENRVEARATLPITATIDHRYVDGWHVSRAMTAFREYLAAPERFEPTAAVSPGDASPGESAHVLRSV